MLIIINFAYLMFKLIYYYNLRLMLKLHLMCQNPFNFVNV